MENSVYKVAFVKDMIFDLCVNKTMGLSPDRFITEEDRDWFEVRLSEAYCLVCETIAFLLMGDGRECCCEELNFTLLKKYKLHNRFLPVKIENALVAIVCDRWMEEYLSLPGETAKVALSDLRSMALKQDAKFNRNSNLS